MAAPPIGYVPVTTRGGVTPQSVKMGEVSPPGTLTTITSNNPTDYNTIRNTMYPQDFGERTANFPVGADQSKPDGGY